MSAISARRLAVMLVIPVLMLAGAVFAAARFERDSAIRAGQQASASQLLLTAMLDQETGSRGYFQTRDQRFLGPWIAGTSNFALALRRSRSLAGSDQALQRALSDQSRRQRVWHIATQNTINMVRSTGTRPTIADALMRKSLVDGFRAANAAFASQLNQRRDHALSVASWLAVGLAAGLSIALLAGGLLIVRLMSRSETERLKSQSELRELLQVSESETESRTLLIRHIERTVPGAGAAILNRNNSDDRLEPVFSDSVDPTPLRSIHTAQMQPRSCMAVRLSRSYERRPGDDPLLQCEVCGKIEADVVCEPLLVAGQVIGAVLVTRDETIGERLRGRLRDSVLQAAPILANQRNLALAETRAASDGLTGLPNRRAADDTLKRMAAHASRSASPLAAVLLDLDHFKEINDVHGHDQGDKALAAVGQILSSTLRASDFCARYGGEEFLILLPDTDALAAYEVSEKLRIAIAGADVSRIGSITASFGVAVLPDHAIESEQLIRKADRALYLAKDHGRNRVETAMASGAGAGEPGGRANVTRTDRAAISTTAAKGVL